MTFPAKEYPLVSVIVPSFNHEKFLAQRLQSIQIQTYRNIEIILLDDASVDNSQQLLEDFAQREPRVSVMHFNKRNSGKPIVQWSRGLNSCNGQFVWIAESDDSCEADFLEKTLKPLINKDSVAVSYSRSVQIDENSDKIGGFELNSALFHRDLWVDNFVVDGNELINNYFPVRNIIPNASSAIFRKKWLLDVIGKVKHLHMLADWLAYVYLVKNRLVAYSDEPLNYCRVHGSGVTRSYNVQKHQRILRERLAIFRVIRNLASDHSMMERAITLMLTNRHKFRQAERVFIRLKQLMSDTPTIAFYGFNDLAKYIMERDSENIRPDLIIDKAKANNRYSGIPILALEEADLRGIEIIAILSLQYKSEMQNLLLSKGFCGKIITV